MKIALCFEPNLSEERIKTIMLLTPSNEIIKSKFISWLQAVKEITHCNKVEIDLYREPIKITFKGTGIA